jgi:hypothetical protein
MEHAGAVAVAASHLPVILEQEAEDADRPKVDGDVCEDVIAGQRVGRAAERADELWDAHQEADAGANDAEPKQQEPHRPVAASVCVSSAAQPRLSPPYNARPPALVERRPSQLINSPT